MTEAQAIEGYGCICGEKFPVIADFRRHMIIGPRKDGKGIHKSIGRINLETGEVVMPPYTERTQAQKDQSRYATKREKLGSASAPSKGTDVLTQATTVQFVPRVFTSTYTPVMQASQKAAEEIWGWERMPLEDFLDTCLHMFFREKGVILAGYIVEETDEERAEREARIRGDKGNGEPTAVKPESAPPEATKPEATEPPQESDIQIAIFKKMIDHMADKQTLTSQDLFNIVKEVTHGS